MKFRLYPSDKQIVELKRPCADARFVWNLALEQQNMYRPEFGRTPGWVEQCRQLTEARAEFSWLATGSAMIQQQALRDLHQAFQNWWRGTHRHPTWRKAGQHEGFRIVGDLVRWKRLSRKRAQVRIPKIGWVDWRWTRHPGEPKSYRVKLD